MERTLAIIKPDAVAAQHVGAILQRIEGAGFEIRAMRLVRLSRADAEGFYAVHRERPFFGSLTAFMSSGPSVALALSVIAINTRLIRSTMLEVLRQDFVQFAKAKGLPRQAVAGEVTA